MYGWCAHVWVVCPGGSSSTVQVRQLLRSVCCASSVRRCVCSRWAEHRQGEMKPCCAMPSDEDIKVFIAETGLGESGVVVTGSEQSMDGFTARSQLITLFSAVNNRGTARNNAAVLTVKPGGDNSSLTMQAHIALCNYSEDPSNWWRNELELQKWQDKI